MSDGSDPKRKTGENGRSAASAAAGAGAGAGARAADRGSTVRVAAIGDVHCARTNASGLQPLFAQMAEAADVIALAGDLTDHGLPEEATLLAQLLQQFKVPVVAVLGNHDYESGHVDEVHRILTDAGVILLDGDARLIEGVGFTGAKGFGGGFGRGTLAAFGEPAVKAFVQEALNEAMRLERGLAQLRARSRIVVMHYSPIRATVEGEPPEIFPYLGCSRFEEPLNRYEVTAVVHGHAHRGAPEGHTTGGTPVYNVALAVMREAYPDRPPFRLLNVPVDTPAAPAEPATVPPVETQVG